MILRKGNLSTFINLLTFYFILYLFISVCISRIISCWLCQLHSKALCQYSFDLPLSLFIVYLTTAFKHQQNVPQTKKWCTTWTLEDTLFLAWHLSVSVITLKSVYLISHQVYGLHLVFKNIWIIFSYKINLTDTLTFVTFCLVFRKVWFCILTYCKLQFGLLKSFLRKF